MLILCSPISTNILRALQSAHPTLAIFHIYSVGFVGLLRISHPELCIIETHPDDTIDLRLFNPWPELVAATAEVADEIEAMTEHQHGHIPYVILLLHYLEQWKLAHGGSLPTSYAQKNEFKKLVWAGMRTDVAGGVEENYEEAVAAVLKNMRPHEISRGTKDVLEDDMCRNLSPDVCEPPLTTYPAWG